MSEETAGHVTDQAVEQSFAVVVEQVIVDLIQITEVEDGTQHEVMKRMHDQGWHITRNIVAPSQHEIITLTKDDKLHHVGQVILDGEDVIHIISTKEEFEKMGRKE